MRHPNGNFAPQGFWGTNLAVTPEQIITWFRQCWQLEVTFEEVRAPLGGETQRPWSGKAIVRTAPTVFGLFSIVVLFAHQLFPQEQWHFRQSAGYMKAHPTFIDVPSLARPYLGAPRLFDRSGSERDLSKVPSQVFSCWLEALGYAA